MVFLGEGSLSNVFGCERAECPPCRGAGAVGQGHAGCGCMCGVHFRVCVCVRGTVPAAGAGLQLGKLDVQVPES